MYPITFRHLGKGAYELQLYATTITQRKKFIEKVEEQQRMLRGRNSNFYSKTMLCENFFNANNRVNCLVPTDGGRKSFTEQTMVSISQTVGQRTRRPSPRGY